MALAMADVDLLDRVVTGASAVAAVDLRRVRLGLVPGLSKMERGAAGGSGCRWQAQPRFERAQPARKEPQANCQAEVQELTRPPVCP
jgi:hypothetical protein